MKKKTISGIALILILIATAILAFNSLKGFDGDIFAVNFDEDEDDDF